MISTRLALVAALVLGGCRADRAVSADPAADLERLIESGRYAEARERAHSLRAADGAYWSGRVQAAEAASAANTSAREEMEKLAIRAFEQSLEADPAQSKSHDAIASILAPRALAAAAAREPGGRDLVGRVAREYEAALRAEPEAKDVAERYLEFCLQAGVDEETERAFLAAVRADNRNATLLSRYGDFLEGRKRDPRAALERFEQALVWNPANEHARMRACSIHIAAAREHLGRRAWALAEAELKAAVKLQGSAETPEGRQVAALLSRLRAIRPGAGF